MQDSIFTRIVKGEIPCHKIHEDELTLAFLDIHPIQPGQVLVIPKKQVEFVWDLDDGTYRAVMATAYQIANRLRQVFPEKARVAMQIEGLEVDHAHIKLFPFDTDQEFRHVPDLAVKPDHTALAKLADILAF